MKLKLSKWGERFRGKLPDEIDLSSYTEEQAFNFSMLLGNINSKTEELLYYIEYPEGMVWGETCYGEFVNGIPKHPEEGVYNQSLGLKP